jgi:hypothetical protein
LVYVDAGEITCDDGTGSVREMSVETRASNLSRIRRIVDMGRRNRPVADVRGSAVDDAGEMRDPDAIREAGREPLESRWRGGAAGVEVAPGGGYDSRSDGVAADRIARRKLIP